ncbi:MAG: MATE family efflux transporter [Burkholderiales bacterium]|nr:MATE family efflux transporter [Burkholderiales bacterium]
MNDAGASRPQALAARTRLLLQDPILPTLLRLSAPNVLNLLAIAGLITFDGLFLARLGPDVLAGVSLVFPFVMFVQHVAASGMGGAVSSAVARALGAGNRQRADDLAAHAFVLALVMGAVFTAVMLALGPLFYRAMGGREAVLAAALSYSGVVFGGAVCVCMLNLLANVVRGTGSMGFPAGVLIGAVALHMLVSPALIFGVGPLPALGPAGAGWGLIVSFGSGSAVLFLHLRKPASLVRLRLRGTNFRLEPFREFFRVGVPGLLNVAINNLAVIVLTGIAGHLGQEAAIGYAMGARLEYIMIPLAFGFGTALVAMVGTNWGAGQLQRARAIAWTGAATVALACGLMGALAAVFPGAWLGLFSADPQVLRAGAVYLGTVAPVYALYGIGMALYFAMQGTGNVRPAVAANAARVLVSAAGGAVAVWLGAGLAGLSVVVACGFAAYGLLTAWWFARAASARKVPERA